MIKYEKFVLENGLRCIVHHDTTTPMVAFNILYDVGAKDEIYKLIRALAAENVAVLVISSDMEEVLRISDRVMVLRNGEVTGSIPRCDATEESILRLAVHHD